MATQDSQWFTEEDLRKANAARAFDELSSKMEQERVKDAELGPSRAAAQFGTTEGNFQAAVSNAINAEGYVGTSAMVQYGVKDNAAGQFSVVGDVSVDNDANFKAFGAGGRWVGGATETGLASNVLAAEAKVIVDDHFKTTGQFIQAAVTWDRNTGLTATNAVIESTRGDVATLHQLSKTFQVGEIADVTLEAHALKPWLNNGKWVGEENNVVAGAGAQYTIEVNKNVDFAVVAGVDAPVARLGDYTANLGFRIMSKDDPAVIASADSSAKSQADLESKRDEGLFKNKGVESFYSLKEYDLASQEKIKGFMKDTFVKAGYTEAEAPLAVEAALKKSHGYVSDRGTETHLDDIPKAPPEMVAAR